MGDLVRGPAMGSSCCISSRSSTLRVSSRERKRCCDGTIRSGHRRADPTVGRGRESAVGDRGLGSVRPQPRCSAGNRDCDPGSAWSCPVPRSVAGPQHQRRSPDWSRTGVKPHRFRAGEPGLAHGALRPLGRHGRATGGQRGRCCGDWFRRRLDAVDGTRPAAASDRRSSVAA